MTRAKATFVKISGKLGNEVYVNNQKQGYFVRRAPAPGSKKKEPAFKRQHSRTKFLNKLASELNRIIELHSDNFEGRDFYQGLPGRFRKEPLDNRFLLLLQVKGMGINHYYPIINPGSSEVTVKGLKSKIEVTPGVKSHPPCASFMEEKSKLIKSFMIAQYCSAKSR